MLSFYTFATRKPALPHYLPDFIGRLLVIRAGNQMSASQTLAFLLHICFLLANPRFRAPCPISSGVCSLFVPETKCLLRRRLLFFCTYAFYSQTRASALPARFHRAFARYSCRKPNVCFADACFPFARIHCTTTGCISLPKNCFLPFIMRFHAIRRISFPVRNKHLLHAFCNNAYPVIPAAQAECGH